MNFIVGLIIIGLLVIGFVKLLNGLRQFSEDPSIRVKEQGKSDDVSIEPLKNEVARDEKTADKIIKELEVELFHAKMAYRTFSLVKGGHERFPAHVSFRRKNNWEYDLIIERKGYELWLTNLKRYKSGSLETDRYSALKEFEKDLYGAYKEELTDDTLLSTEWIADDLLLLDDPDAEYDSDFTLRWSWPVQKMNQHARELLRNEIENTKINLKERDN